ncbi:MAG: hypothetical protein HFG59_09320 [Lachnospiraceae bacterium]|nr:hypothetical protein [Lachnospiraceae bacterium]
MEERDCFIEEIRQGAGRLRAAGFVHAPFGAHFVVVYCGPVLAQPVSCNARIL